MAINLRDIPDAVQAYLNTKVNVTFSPFIIPGTSLNPNEGFTFSVSASNADAANGGVALKNVKYRISVDDPAVAKVLVPAGGSATDLAGNPLVAGTKVGAFIFAPTGASSSLGVGDTDSIALQGAAGSGSAGGTTSLQARIIADVDVDKLFPKGEDTPAKSKAITVEG